MTYRKDIQVDRAMGAETEADLYEEKQGEIYTQRERHTQSNRDK